MARGAYRWALLWAAVALALAACQSPSGAAEEAPAGDEPSEAEEESPEVEVTAAEEEASGEAEATSGEEEEEPAEAGASEAEEEVDDRPFVYDPLALEVIAYLNEWRLVEGLWPFKPNAELTELARGQAEYIAGLADWPNDVHEGPDGSSPKERAAAAGWPHYNTPEQIAITEITVVSSTPQAATQWWNGSQVHHDSVVNPGYREIGVAAVEHPWGHLYVAVLGGRPDVLPAFIEPEQSRVYFSSEQYTWATGGDWLNFVSQLQVLDEAGQPDGAAWLPWQYALNLQRVEGPPFYVAYSDEIKFVTTEVVPGVDTLWLPGNLPAEDEIAPTAEAGEEAEAPAGEVAEAEGAEEEEAPAAPTASMHLVYKDTSFALINTSGGLLDLTGLAFVGEDDTTLLATRWANTGPVTALPEGDCMEFVDWTVGSWGIPTGCRFRLAQLYIPPDEVFWKAGTFDVLMDGDTLATCEATAAACYVNLP